MHLLCGGPGTCSKTQQHSYELAVERTERLMVVGPEAFAHSAVQVQRMHTITGHRGFQVAIADPYSSYRLLANVHAEAVCAQGPGRGSIGFLPACLQTCFRTRQINSSAA